MERIRKAEKLDILTLSDASGNVFYRACNPLLRGDSQKQDVFVQYVLRNKAPASSTDIVPHEELIKESGSLAEKALMNITPTPMAGPAGQAQLRSGMMLKSAAPVFTAGGKFVGVLVGGGESGDKVLAL